MHSLDSFLLAAATMSLSASAHMIMSNPKPFAAITLNNAGNAASPISDGGGGGAFPCKYDNSANFYDRTSISNVMAIGEPQTLEFKAGGAPHTGGSCQLALTADQAPTASSTWMVIHSIEGGCPTKNSGASGDTYAYTIPDGIAPGEYVFAWTWVAKESGGPEYYMNCAPVTVTGGAKKRDLLAERAANFPNLFVANIASVNSCKTTPGTDVVYPDPGNSVDKPATSPKYDAITQTGCVPVGGSGSGRAAVPATPADNSSPSAVGGSPTPSPSTMATSTITTAPAPENTDPVSLSIPSAAPTPAPPALVPTSVVVVPSTPSPSAAPDAPDAVAGPSSPMAVSGALTGACSTEGMWNCISGTAFQRCASGMWSAATAMAPGTSCTPGQTANFAILRRGGRFGRFERGGLETM